jgi:nucleotide-binding universal stress UspA family protein
VIVPDGWSVRDPAPGPVVAGIDGSLRDEPVLEHAFERAGRTGARLVLVAAAQLPGFYAWESWELDRWVKEAEDRLTEEMGPWARRFPDVALDCRAPVSNAAVAILGAARDARVVVLGRYAGRHHGTGVMGLSGLSTSRKVLHHATCPVAVVPVPVGDPDAFHFDDTDAPQF